MKRNINLELKVLRAKARGETDPSRWNFESRVGGNNSRFRKIDKKGAVAKLATVLKEKHERKRFHLVKLLKRSLTQSKKQEIRRLKASAKKSGVSASCLSDVKGLAADALADTLAASGSLDKYLESLSRGKKDLKASVARIVRAKDVREKLAAVSALELESAESHINDSEDEPRTSKRGKAGTAEAPSATKSNKKRKLRPPADTNDSIDDSEFDSPYSNVVGSMFMDSLGADEERGPQKKKKKNRLSQRARRELAEKKYGQETKMKLHDLKNPFSSSVKKKMAKNSGSGREDGAAGGSSGGSQDDGAGLHPSWQARKNEAKSASVVEFKGKKVVFD